MPLNDLKERQKQLAEVGRIRLGQKVPTASGGVRPAKLATLRFTSPAKHLIEEVSRTYGGTPQSWQGSSGPEFEVVTTVSEVPVYLARQKIDPWYEMWGPGVMQRRCDGITESKRNVPCLCAPVRASAQTAGRDLKPGEVCKPTTRASVMLADIPGFGVWRVDSHGINAATKGLGGHVADWIATLPDGVRIPARLMMVPHKEKHLIIRNGQERIDTYEFMVPTLFVDGVSARQIQGGTESLVAAITAMEQRQAVARQLAAIEAGPAADGPAGDGTKLTSADVVRLAPYTRTVEQLQELWRDAAKDEALTGEVKAVLKARAAELDKARTEQAAAPAAPVPQPPAGEPVDAEIVPEPDKDVLWVQIQAAAGKRKWNAAGLEERIYSRFKRTSDEMTGWDMEKFLADIKSGAIA